MWIVFAVLAAIAALVVVILLLPVSVIVRTDENNEIVIRYRFLGKLYGEESNPNNPVAKTLKKAVGVDRLEKKQLKDAAHKEGVAQTAMDTFRVLVDLLREIGGLLKHVTITRLSLRIVCAGEDAAAAAFGYGQCCAVVYPIVGLIGSLMKIRPRGQKIDITCDYEQNEETFDLDVVVMVRVFRVLAAFFRVVMAEAKRAVDEELDTPAPKHAAKRR